jgi:hypothetical protein
MKTRQRWICLSLALAAGPSFAGSTGCGLPEITGAGELNHFLGLRAVELVKRAANLDERLPALVAPSASFNLGAGDVGRSLGTGVGGARELARAMNADAYRFLGWDYMDMPIDACSKHEVEVEFIDSRGKNVSQVKFTFLAGRVVSADGWSRSFESGRL